jgi:uroporphyrinogen decarboxylase
MMDRRQRVLAAVEHRVVDRIPVMYRGLPETTHRLCEFLGLKSADEDWLALLDKLGADLFSGGSSMGRYTRVEPRYVGPQGDPHAGSHLDHVWGLVARPATANGHTYADWPTHPMASFTTTREIERYPSPDLRDFDFSGMQVDEDVKQRSIYSLGKLNHVFILASRLRGMDRLLMDMAGEPTMAEALLEKVAQFAVEFNRRSLHQVGSQVDQYVLWDDIATQRGMMMSPEHWNRYLRKWYEILFRDAKQCGLKVFYHCCGSFHPIIPTLIDIGVDILDPVQTSAREMDLRTLRGKYGNNVCWHGGIDVQNLLPYKTVPEVRQAVAEAEELFGCEGGIVLGPSHEITPDTPIENILAIYSM